MRKTYSREINELFDKVKPYLYYENMETHCKEGTPPEIVEMNERLDILLAEDFKKDIEWMESFKV